MSAAEGVNGDHSCRAAEQETKLLSELSRISDEACYPTGHGPNLHRLVTREPHSVHTNQAQEVTNFRPNQSGFLLAACLTPGCVLVTHTGSENGIGK